MSTAFNASFYLSSNPDVVLAISQGFFSSAQQHFSLFGGRELRDPNSTFNSNYYSVQNPDVLAAVSTGVFANSFEHFKEFGVSENRAPTVAFSTFDAAAYLEANTDIAEAVTAGTISSALEHYMAFGATEGRTGSGISADVINPGTTFTLTTGTNAGTDFTGGSGDDSYNADLSSTGTNTLNTLDRLEGGAGTDTLQAVLASTVTPASIANIENIIMTASGGARELGLANATGVTTVTASGSGAAATVSGINAGAALNMQSTGSNAIFTFASTTGTQTVALGVNAVTAGNFSVAGVENVTVTSTGSASAYVLVTAAATSTAFAGASNQTVTLTGGATASTTFDGSAMTGNLNLTLTNQTGLLSTADVTMTGGAGNDTLTGTAHTQSDLSIAGGAGDDKIVNTVLAATDSVDGGDGTDEISMLDAAAQILDGSAATTVILTNIEQIEVTDQLATGTLTTQNIVASNKITLSNAAANAALLAGAADVVGAAGDYTVDLGHSVAGNTARVLGANLTITDTGTGTTDSVTINNKSNTGTGTAEIDVLDGRAITSAGYETVSIVTGSSNGAAQQDVSTLTITPDSTDAAVNLNISGSAAIDIGTSLTTTSTALMTVDASGMTAQTAGTTTLDIGATSQGTGGTASITGTSGDDQIIVGAFATTMAGAEGQDTLTGGSAADNITGGAGNDIISSGGGNDVIDGGAGNDTLTVGAATAVSVTGGAGNDVVNMNSTLTSSDTIDGGEGTDTLAIDAAATASAGAGLSNFEILRLDTGGLSQDMVQFSSNQGFTNITTNATGTHTVSNMSSSIVGASLITGSTTVALSRLLDNSSNALEVDAGTAGGTTVTTLTVNDEETLTFDDGAMTTSATYTVGTLNADDLVTLNVTGVSNFTITNAIVGANDTLVTVDASANAGTVDIDVANATVGVTMSGAAGKANTLAGGTKNDSITGGSAADIALSGAAGADTITGGGGNDSITGGTGSDSLVGGEGADSLDGGGGSDTFDLTETTSAADVVELTAVMGTSADTERVAQVGDDNDTGKDTIVAPKYGTDTILITSTAQGAFAHGSDTAIGTATGDVNDGTVGSFLTNVGLVNLNDANAALTDAGDLAMNFTAASTATADSLTEARFEAMLQYNITGVAAADIYVLGGLADTIDGAAGADTITGGGGNDSITVDDTASISAKFIFGASGAANGLDTITDADGGTSAANGEVFDFTAFVTGRLEDKGAAANTGTTIVTEFAAADTTAQDVNTNVVAFDHAGTKLTLANVAAEFAAAGTAFANTANGKTVIIAGNAGAADVNAQIFYVDDSLDGVSGTYSTTDVVEVASLATAIDLDTITGNQIS